MRIKDSGNNILSVRNITKTYPGVIAIDNLNADFMHGEVHALMERENLH